MADDDAAFSGLAQNGRVTNAVDNGVQLVVFGLYLVFGLRRATALAHRRHRLATRPVKASAGGDSDPRQRLLDALTT